MTPPPRPAGRFAGSVLGRSAVRLGCVLALLYAALFPMAGATLVNQDEVKARLVLEAYRRAFPDRVDSIEYRDGDWSIVVVGKRFFWTSGRLMPEKDRAAWEKYEPYSFAFYPYAIRDPRRYSDKLVAALRREGAADERMKDRDHHPGFRAALYGGATRGAVGDHLSQVRLFGKSVTVHDRIVSAIKRVDLAVYEASRTDPAARAFLDNVGSVGGYNWREIRGTTRLSYHSWGLAVDVTPKRTGDLIVYWGWERVRNDDWMLVPLDRRWAPPDAVVKAFEAEGFAWGGKWELYDCMHFEYRPELFEVRRVLSAVGGLKEIESAGEDDGS